MYSRYGGKDTRATCDYLALPGPCAYVVPATKYPKVEGSQVRTLITPYYIQNTSIRYPKKVTVSQPCTHRVVLIMLVYVEYNMYYLLYYYIKCPVLLGFLFPSQHCSTLFTRSHLQKYPLKSTLCVRKYTNLSFQRSCLHWLVTTYSRPFFLASFPGWTAVYIRLPPPFCPSVSGYFFAAELEITLNSTFRHLFFFPIPS